MRHLPVNHPDDLEDLGRLFEACRSADGHASIGEHKYLDLVAGNADRALGRVFLIEQLMIAYVHLTPRTANTDWVLETALHPDHRDPPIVREVLQAAIDVVADAGGGTVRLWVYHPAVDEVVEDLGFRQERRLLQMRLPLPPRLVPNSPPGHRLTNFEVGADEEAWIEMNNRAFAGHPENGSWDRSILADRIRQDWFDPEGLLMAWEGSRLSGFCWTKVHPQSMGEIYVVAVNPDRQRQTLGTWLTLEGLWYLYRHRNVTTAMLYVDAANQSALAMYEGLGFSLDHIDRAYTREVAADQPETGRPNTRSHDGQA